MGYTMKVRYGRELADQEIAERRKTYDEHAWHEANAGHEITFIVEGPIDETEGSDEPDWPDSDW